MIFTVWIETDSFEMPLSEIWPDGDAPANPTEEDVAEAMRNYGSVERVIEDWDLLANPRICISGQGGVAEVY